ncbi:flavin reductase family protein [Paraburkholderia tropica]|uniref:flavin reductase family protein n=1 Tax=Paraburkholderia tropica TaxID=92647 RepID=UPI002AB6038A|nr:flavin reductase family protein [Paraburkholderia tropica]
MQPSTAGDVPAFSPDDARTLRAAFGQFPTGVAVVTVPTTDGTHAGMTISSFNTVSLDPPLVLFSVRRGSAMLPLLVDAPSYAINVLSEEQTHLSNHFARSDSRQWNDIAFRHGHLGAALLDDALLSLECRHFARYDGGDHVIVVGQVIHGSIKEQAQPLIFFRGQYHAVASPRTAS